MHASRPVQKDLGQVRKLLFLTKIQKEHNAHKCLPLIEIRQYAKHPHVYTYHQDNLKDKLGKQVLHQVNSTVDEHDDELQKL